MTDADLLRKTLPRLHAAGIATGLNVPPADTGWASNFHLGDGGKPICWISEQDAVTYAIGAILEHLVATDKQTGLVEFYWCESDRTTLEKLINELVTNDLIKE